MSNVLVIFGPTASGKSRMAMQLAEELNGEIINADSRQIYRHMPIISACPSAQDYAQIRHHLFEEVDPSERFSAAKWAALAQQKIAEVLARGKQPIVVGGTGFYLRTLMEGMSPVPEVAAATEAEVSAMPSTERFQLLQKVDMVLAAKLHATDTQRVVRALAVWKGTGTPLSVWQQRQGQGADYVFYKVGILPERDDLHRRIEARWNEMLEIGLEDELRSLQKKGYTAEMPGLQGLGIAAFFDYFAGKLTREQALEAGVVAHRQYAKRQCTWLRNSYHADKILAKAELEDVKMLVVSAFNVPR